MAADIVPVVIDTDAGMDDAWAIFTILRAHRDPSNAIRLVGITCVDGNTKLDNVVVNVTRTLEAGNALDVPLFRGCESALAVRLVREPGFVSYHGADGFGDAGFAPTDPKIQEEHAALSLIRLSKEYAGKLKILAIGPLTNLALAIKLDPTITSRIHELHIMGGNIEGVGNITVLGEFNFRADPEAAYVTLTEYKCPIILTPWEVCKRQELKDFRVDVLGNIQSTQMELMNKAEVQVLQWPRWSPADGLAAAALVEPKIIMELRELHVTVELSGNYARGMMVVDHENKLKQRVNAKVIYKVDTELYKQVLAWAVGGPPFM